MQRLDPSIPYVISPSSQLQSFIGVDATSSLKLVSRANALQLYVTNSTYDSSKTNICGLTTTGKFCLDQFGNNVTQASYSTVGYYSGQQLTLTGLLQFSGYTYWRLQSDFGGDRLFSAQGDNIVLVLSPNANTAYWRFFEALGASSTTTMSASSSAAASATQSSASSAATATSTADSAAAATTAVTPSQSVSIPIGGIVGIAIGIVVLIAIAVGLIWFFVRRSKLRKREKAASMTPSPMAAPVYKTMMVKRKSMAEPLEMPANQQRRGTIYEVDGEMTFAELDTERQQHR